MASNDSISKFRTGIMPALAILRFELRGLLASWLVGLWLAAAVLLTLVLLGGAWAKLPSSQLIASALFPFLVFPWFLVVIVLGVTPVAGARAEVLADGVLSRPITRYEYILASWASRVVLVLSVFLIVALPTVLIVAFAKRPVVDETVTTYGTVVSLGLVGLVQTFLVSLGFLAGTLLRRPLLAVVVLVFVWYPINLVLNAFALEELSPISLNQALPALLRQPWDPAKDVAPAAIRDDDLEAVAEQAARFLNVLSGQPRSVPKAEPGFFDRDVFGDSSVPRVMLGYGVPTVLALSLATWCFCRRDL